MVLVEVARQRRARLRLDAHGDQAARARDVVRPGDRAARADEALRRGAADRVGEVGERTDRRRLLEALVVAVVLEGQRRRRNARQRVAPDGLRVSAGEWLYSVPENR